MKLSSLEIKILVINAFLYEKKKIANAEGLLKILNGIEDEETSLIQKEKVFGSMLSLKSRRLKMVLHHLVQNGYLRQSYRNEMFYFINTDLGDSVVEENKFIIRKATRYKEKIPSIIDL